MNIARINAEVAARVARATLPMHTQNVRHWARKQFVAMGFCLTAAIELANEAMTISPTA